jgi:hypothetical protein
VMRRAGFPAGRGGGGVGLRKQPEAAIFH